ncbi:MAG TPA: hypothetical protein VFA17_00400 [Thermoplasmata archaeon]|jgi:hypothetical protein|nr:hypothetical protein [Thermoplasmata archaeon]
MTKDGKAEMATIVTKQLQGRGYVISLTTSREGENLIGKVRVSEASTQREVANLVSVWKVDDLHLVFGLDASEGTARDFMSQAMNFFDLFKYAIPGVEIREEGSAGHHD